MKKTIDQLKEGLKADLDLMGFASVEVIDGEGVNKKKALERLAKELGLEVIVKGESSMVQISRCFGRIGGSKISYSRIYTIFKSVK